MNKSEISNWVKKDYPNGRLSDNVVQGLHLKKNAKSISWRILYRDASGKQRNIVIGRYPSITLDEARKRGKEIYAEIIRGNDPLKQRNELKVSSLSTLQGYLDSIYDKILTTKKSGRETRQIFSRYFTSLFKKGLSTIDAKDITGWQREMIERKKSFATQQRAYGALKTLLNDAVKRGVIEKNPLSNISLDRIHESEQTHLLRKSKRSYLTKEQINFLFHGLDIYQETRRKERHFSRAHGRSYLPCLENVTYVDHVVPFILFMFYTGFRNGDVYGLRWEHIHFHENSATVHKTIEKTAHKKPEAKTFPLASEIVDVLKKWHLQNGAPKAGYVFANPEGKRMGDKAMSRPWKKIKKFSGLPESLDLYTLRHNFASWLVMGGNDLMTVAKLLGHSDIRMIIDHYGHLQPTSLEKAVSENFAASFRQN